MKKLIILLIASLCLVACSNDENSIENVATYSHDVDGGYIYTDNKQGEIFIDTETLEDLNATTEQNLLITFNDTYDWEIDKIEVAGE